MQTALMLWMVEERPLLPSSLRLRMLPDRRSGIAKRCQRCDILLGSTPCPNPSCGESHGERVGNLCAWCYEHQQERFGNREGDR